MKKSRAHKPIDICRASTVNVLSIGANFTRNDAECLLEFCCRERGQNVQIHISPPVYAALVAHLLSPVSAAKLHESKVEGDNVLLTFSVAGCRLAVLCYYDYLFNPIYVTDPENSIYHYHGYAMRERYNKTKAEQDILVIQT